MLAIKEILKKYHIVANKNLGQNFLIEDDICAKIAVAAKILPDDFIVEVGSGVGSLTRHLLNATGLLIEKDFRFIEILQNEYDLSNFKLHNEDALKFDFTSIAEDFKVIANLPYNVGTQLLVNWISLKNRPKTMVLMLQKEVVERIIAKTKNKDYGRLSILSQSFYDCIKLFDVPKGSFIPSPNVISSVVLMTRKDVSFDVVKLGKITEVLFQNRRKMLKHGLAALNINKPEFNEKRAEELTVADFLSFL